MFIVPLPLISVAPRQLIVIAERVVHGFGYLDSVGQTTAFHSACDVHRVSPNLVVQLLGAEHASNHRPTMDTKSHFDGMGVIEVSKLP